MSERTSPQCETIGMRIQGLGAYILAWSVLLVVWLFIVDSAGGWSLAFSGGPTILVWANYLSLIFIILGFIFLVIRAFNSTRCV